MADASVMQNPAPHRWSAVTILAVALILAVAACGFAFIRSEVAIREASTARALLDDARRQLDDARKQLDESRRELDDSHHQFAAARHQLDDARRQIDEMGRTEHNPTAPGNDPQTAIPVPGPVVTISDLLMQASKLRAEARLREAEIILTRAVQTDRDHIEAWRALARVQRDMSAASIKAGDLLSAAHETDRARISLNSIKGISVDPTTTVDPKVVLDEDDLTAKAAADVRTAIDKFCKSRIADGRQCASNAFHSSWNVMAMGFRPIKNDRNEVVKGLTNLKQAFELGAWASEDIRTSANVAFGNLKKLVNPDEWSELLVKAGFDPSSRDALKKSGLE